MGRQGKVNKCSHFLKWCKQEKKHPSQFEGRFRLFGYSYGKPGDFCGSQPSRWPQRSSPTGIHTVTQGHSYPAHTGSGLTCVASTVEGCIVPKGIVASAFLLCILCSLILVTLGKTSCHVVRTLKHSCGEAYVGGTKASTNLLAM